MGKCKLSHLPPEEHCQGHLDRIAGMTETHRERVRDFEDFTKVLAHKLNCVPAYNVIFAEVDRLLTSTSMKTATDMALDSVDLVFELRAEIDRLKDELETARGELVIQHDAWSALHEKMEKHIRERDKERLS